MVILQDQCCIYCSVDLQNQEGKITSQCATAKQTRPNLTCLKLTRELSDTNNRRKHLTPASSQTQTTTDQADWGEREGRGLAGGGHLGSLVWSSGRSQSSACSTLLTPTHGQLACFLPLQYRHHDGKKW